MRKINLSFAACGFLGIYHLGAAAAFCRHGQKLLKDVKAFAGASAGSLVASVLLTAPEKLQECDQFTYKLAEETRSQSLGAMTPGYDFMARLRNGMELILPPNAHELAQNRLHVSITNTKTRENYLVSDFLSREDLIKHMQPRLLGMDVQDLVSEKCLNGTLGSLSVAEATHFPKRGFAYKAAKSHICLCKVLLASSFVPVYTGLRPVEYQGQKWVDGGLTNSLPVLPMGRTVTISPFCGRLDICPQDRGQLDLYLNITNQDIMLSLANLVRLNQALFPPSKRKMESLYQSGFNDTVKFLRKENWFE